MPARFIEPCLPSPADRPPSGSNWIHEIKHDGYRLMARRGPVGIRLITRRGNGACPRGALTAPCRVTGSGVDQSFRRVLTVTRPTLIGVPFRGFDFAGEYLLPF